ncbi:hypothetical protein CERSUDRAFT_114914 [Gelatoporia subvermispora B]|uniref:DDH domain-containing protein n=1 Tax=Ceriporiopsis subvermispora (strain B) TaxID=914234 RepID=M2REZ5_CERS8|nr:hypothetical protein CERSUDRAFT_114914 [Gelatoporia subvermispora B]
MLLLLEAVSHQTRTGLGLRYCHRDLRRFFASFSTCASSTPVAQSRGWRASLETFALDSRYPSPCRRTAVDSRYLHISQDDTPNPTAMSNADMEAQAPCSDTTLASFLNAQRSAYLSALQSGRADEWTIATGNEAGDLDSFASAIALSYYLTRLAPNPIPTVPLALVAREDFGLRAENLHALALAGLDPAAPPLLCLDDLPTPCPTRRFALVDHNRLHPRFDSPDARVVAVVDHHEDEGLYTDSASPRTVQVPVGSCASLVTRLFEERADAHVPPRSRRSCSARS